MYFLKNTFASGVSRRFLRILFSMTGPMAMALKKKGNFALSYIVFAKNLGTCARQAAAHLARKKIRQLLPPTLCLQLEEDFNVTKFSVKPFKEGKCASNIFSAPFVFGQIKVA